MEIEKNEFALAKKRNHLNSTFPTFTEQDVIQRESSSRDPENFQIVIGMVSGNTSSEFN